MKRFLSQSLIVFFVAIAATLLLSIGSSAPQANDSLARLPDAPAMAEARTRSHLILFRRGLFDTRLHADRDTSEQDRLALSTLQPNRASSVAKRLRIIQFTGVTKSAWIEELRSTGVEIIGYLPNNAYILRGTAEQFAEIAALPAAHPTARAGAIQWMGRFEAINKIAPQYDDELLSAPGDARTDVEIELLDAPETDVAMDRIQAAAERVNRAPRRFLHYVVLSVRLPVAELLNLAEIEEVLFIAPDSPARPNDERSAQIVAGNLLGDGVQPIAPGYRTWLAAKGLDFESDTVVDVTDSGMDRGSTLASLIHSEFRDANEGSRVIYNTNYNQGDSGEDRGGHGTLVASIIAGRGTTSPLDDDDYLYGLGIDPNAKVGASRIFNDQGSLPFQLSLTTLAATAYAKGARISNNSWGSAGNAYTTTAQEYDALTRDAQPNVPGNQEMLFVFAAGNQGTLGKIDSPGTAKNVITVAASENYRPAGMDSCNLDGGGGIGPDGADSVHDILRYSSSGPTVDGRRKPDLTAPGTHIFGAATRASIFTSTNLCPGVPKTQPPGQPYTWSSGTSLATPHVTGSAALVRKFFTARQLLGAVPPSPAMTKAFLVNSARYLTGENAGGNLPAERQGFGLVDLGSAFDDTARRVLDQSRLFTESDQTFEMHGSLADRSQPLRVTLAWTDAPGSLAGAAIVNDLDLEIKIGEATIYRGNHFEGAESVEGGAPDRLNSVESIMIPAEQIPEGADGNFTIFIRAANIAGDGVPGNESLLDQDFALVVSNITDPLPPLPTKPEITNATYIRKILTITGRGFSAAAMIEINGVILTQTFNFDAATNALSLKKKSKKLKLKTDFDNQIVIIENNRRSLPFTLRL